MIMQQFPSVLFLRTTMELLMKFQRGRPLTIWKNDEAIGIDCGSGYDYGRLACLRLDDMKVFYSE